MPLRKKVRRLKSLTVTRVDVVDKGACRDDASGDGSFILLLKRDVTPDPPGAPSPVERAEAALLSGLVRAEIAKQWKVENPIMENTIVVTKSKARELLLESSQTLDAREVRKLSEDLADTLTVAEIYDSLMSEARKLAAAGKYTDEYEALSAILEDRGRRHARLAYSEGMRLATHRQQGE